MERRRGPGGRDRARARRRRALPDRARPPERRRRSRCAPRGPGLDLALDPGVLAGLRERKAPDELEQLRAAGREADAAMAWVAGADLDGRSERWLALELQMRFLRRGAEPYDYVIASGPNGALPHHETGETPISAGAPLLTDFGCVVGGYYSDMTRVHLPADGGEAAEAYAIVPRGPRRRDRRARAGAAVPRGRPARARRDRGRGLRRALHPPHRPRRRARDPRGALPAPRQPGAAAGRATSSASSRGSTCPAASGSATRTSCTSAPTGRSCSTAHRRGPKRLRGIRVVARRRSRQPRVPA